MKMVEAAAVYRCEAADNYMRFQYRMSSPHFL